MLFYTINQITDDVSLIADSEKITSIDDLQSWPNNSDTATFRIGFEGATETSVAIFSSNPSLLLSLDDIRLPFAATIEEYPLVPDKVGGTIYVRLSADFDTVEGNRTDAIHITGTGIAESITINYFVAGVNESFTARPVNQKYFGSNTASHVLQFTTFGQVVTLRRYDPLNKPLFGTLSAPFRVKDHRSITDHQEWMNPNNKIVGWESTDFKALAFVGERSITQNLSYNNTNLDIKTGDLNSIAISPLFEGFEPSPWKRKALISRIIKDHLAFQFSEWTMIHEGNEYSLANLKQISFFRGETIYWASDLTLIKKPSTDTDGFIPFNQLRDTQGRVIDYARGWTDKAVSDDLTNCVDVTCDSTTSALEDPYDPYLCVHNPFKNIETIVYHGSIWQAYPWYENRKLGTTWNLETPPAQQQEVQEWLATLSPEELAEWESGLWWQ